MLPRFPARCCFQRHPPSRHHNGHTTAITSTTAAAISSAINQIFCSPAPAVLTSNSLRRHFTTLTEDLKTKSNRNGLPFHHHHNQIATFPPSPLLLLNSYRYKSTKLLQKNRNEPEESQQQSEDENKSGRGNNLNKIDFPLKKDKLPATSSSGSSLIPQKSPLEEEKSRRRFEKEDPPEEERHREWKKKEDRAINKALMRTDFFDNMSNKNNETFAFALELFTDRDVHLRGHVEFIYAALKEMKRFGVHRDLDSYKKLIDVFPKGKMIQTNMFQTEFMHFPKHQQCAIDLLEQMEEYGVIPDSEVQELLTNIFGSLSFPMRKAGRMLYWMPKFKHLSPWKLPEVLPDSAMELAKLAVAQMTSVDLTTKISIYDCSELEDAQDMTWIVSGQSLEQQQIIEKLPKDRPIYVEGAFRMWMRNTCMNYFVLRADAKPPKPKTKIEEDPHDVGELSSVFDDDFLEKSVAEVKSVHEQADGVILALCCTGSSSRDSLVSWIRFLEQSNPRLGKDITVWFTLKSPIGPTDDIEVLSYQDLEELKRLGKPRDPFLAEAKLENENLLDIDPGMPDLRQTGVWTESESKFPNWPHHFHKEDSISAKNRKENEKLLEERERKELEQKRSHQEIESMEGSRDKNKRIED